MNKEFKVRCPQCALTFSYYESEFRPFCSEKCQMIDLGHWFKESYTVPVKETGKTAIPSQEKGSNEEFEGNQENNKNNNKEEQQESGYEENHNEGYSEEGHNEDEDYNESDYH